MLQQILEIAIKENYTIADVRTLLRIALITDLNDNLKDKYTNTPIMEIWATIPHKRENLHIYNSVKKKNKKSKAKKTQAK